MNRSLIVVQLFALAPVLMGAAADDGEMVVAQLTQNIAKVDHTIRATKDLIKQSGDAVYLADLYVRLAELYVEKSRYAFARLAEQDPSASKTVAGDTALEVRIVKEMAIDTYERVLRNFPDYEQRDRVRFFKAHEYRELGEWQAMLAELRTLIAKHRRSDWAIEARLIIADYHFDKNEIDAAEQHYRAILDLPDSHLHDMASYKLGWIRINQDRFAEALAHFERAVSSRGSDRRGAVGDARRVDVKQEALLAMAWPYSETRTAADAPAYFRRLARSKTSYVRVLRKLGDRYFIKTEFAKAAAIYRDVVRLSADVEKNIDYVQRIYESVRNMSRSNPGRYTHAATDVDAIVETLARFENHPGAEREHKRQLERDFEVRARDLSTRLHLQAQKTRSVVSARAAAEAYRKYLSLFDGGEDAAELRVNRAEVLFQARRYIDAGYQYEEVARAVDGRARRAAVYDAIVAYRRAIEQEAAYRAEHPNARLFNKLELLRARSGLQQLGAYFVKEWPAHARTPEVKLNIARMHYQDGDFERAAELYAAFVVEYPRHDDVAEAAHLAMDSLQMLERFEELASYAEGVVGNSHIASARLKTEAAQIAKQARDLKRRHDLVYLDPEEVRRRWLDSSGEAGEGDLYTGFLAARSHRRVGDAFLFGDELIQRYPESKHVAEVYATLAHLAQQSGDFERGAALLEELQRARPDHEGAAATAQRVATVRALLGDYQRAAASLRLLRRIGDRDEKARAHRQLMVLYRDLEDWDTLASAAKTAIEWDDGWLVAHAHLGIAYAHQGKDTLAERHLAHVIGAKPASEADRAIFARATFAYGQLFHRVFERTHFAGVATAERVLARKLELLAASERAYVTVVNAGVGEWAIAALREVARLYHDLAGFVVEAPLPSMPAADEKAARAALAEQAGQWRAQAQQTLAACGTKAEELRVLTPAGSACASGGTSTVAGRLVPRRPDLSADQDHRVALVELHAGLAARPEDRDLLRDLARVAMRAGDFHLGRLVLAHSAQLDPRNPATQNLLGVAAWHLGEVEEAAAAFERVRQRSPRAALNLAALLDEYGYARSARRLVREADTRGVDLSTVDVHPRVRVMLQNMGGS